MVLCSTDKKKIIKALNDMKVSTCPLPLKAERYAVYFHRCVMINLTVIVMMAGHHPTVTKEVEVEVLTAALRRSVRSRSL